MFREFCRIVLGRERVPDAMTLLNFRHLLEAHQLGAALFAKVGELLLVNSMELSGGTIVDATLIAAPPSVKSQDKSRDPNLLHGGEPHFYDDGAYRGKGQRERLKEIALKAKDFTNKRAYKARPLTEADTETNRRKSSMCSKVEHSFLILKCLWGFAKTRYRGLAKDANRTFAMLAMLSINKWRRSLTGETRPARAGSGEIPRF